MLHTNAVFSRKESDFRPKDCVVEKVVRLSGAEYDSFAGDMLRDRDFIRNNYIDTVVDADGRYHCLLIVGDGRRDGILVNPEGGDYARYSAFIPNAEDFLTVGQSPALAALNKRLTGIVDDIVEQAGAEPSGDRVEIDLEALEAKHGMQLLGSDILDTVLGMLGERPGTGDFEIDKNELIIYREPGGAKAVDGNERDGERREPIEAFIANQERHENGETVGEWLRFPADAETLAGLFIRIGVTGPYDEGYIISDFRSPYEGVREALNSDDRLDELNALASHMSDMEDWELDKLKAILKLDVIGAGDGAEALINLIYDDNFSAFNLIDASNEEELGRYWDEEDPMSYPEGVSHAEHGREIAAEEKGLFTEWGYVSFSYKELSQEYDGIVPHEYRIVDMALLDAARHTAPDRGARREGDEKPSVMEQIQKARQAARQQGKDAPQKHKKDKGGPEL